MTDWWVIILQFQVGLFQAPLNPLKTDVSRGPPGLSGGPGPLRPHRNSTTGHCQWENHCWSAMLSSVSPWWRQLWPADELCWSSDHHRRLPCSSTWADVHPPSTLYHKHTHTHTHTVTCSLIQCYFSYGFSVSVSVIVVIYQLQFQLVM